MMPDSTSPDPAVARLGGRVVGNRRATVRGSHDGVCPLIDDNSAAIFSRYARFFKL